MTANAESRNLIMSRSIEGTKVQYPFCFVIAGPPDRTRSLVSFRPASEARPLADLLTH